MSHKFEDKLLEAGFTHEDVGIFFGQRMWDTYVRVVPHSPEIIQGNPEAKRVRVFHFCPPYSPLGVTVIRYGRGDAWGVYPFREDVYGEVDARGDFTSPNVERLKQLLVL